MQRLTPKQQRFCLLIVQGETQSKAYQLAGYATKRTNVAAVNANQLLKNPNVQGEIARLQEMAANRAVVSVESLTRDLIDIKVKALQAGSYAPAVAAVQVIARINGLMVDKSEVTVMHRPAPFPTKILELSEQDWVRQFGHGLQEKRLAQLESLDRRERKKSS